MTFIIIAQFTCSFFLFFGMITYTAHVCNSHFHFTIFDSKLLMHDTFLWCLANAAQWNNFGWPNYFSAWLILIWKIFASHEKCKYQTPRSRDYINRLWYRWNTRGMTTLKYMRGYNILHEYQSSLVMQWLSYRAVWIFWITFLTNGCIDIRSIYFTINSHQIFHFRISGAAKHVRSWNQYSFVVPIIEHIRHYAAWTITIVFTVHWWRLRAKDSVHAKVKLLSQLHNTFINEYEISAQFCPQWFT